MVLDVTLAVYSTILDYTEKSGKSIATLLCAAHFNAYSAIGSVSWEYGTVVLASSLLPRSSVP